MRFFKACTQTKFFRPFSFFLTFFCCNLWSSTGLASSWRTLEKALLWWDLSLECPSVVEGNFALHFSILFLNIFVHTSRLIDPITLIWVWLERSFPPAELEYRWCQFWSKVKTSEVEQRPTLVTAGGYVRHRRLWATKCLTIGFLFSVFNGAWCCARLLGKRALGSHRKWHPWVVVL